MAILDTVKKIIPYIKTATGYVLCRLSSQAVEMDDGTVLQDKIESMDTAINGKAPSSHTHPVSQVTGLTGSRALVSDSSGHPAVSAVTSTELGYLDGAKSNIQSQINTLNSNLKSFITYKDYSLPCSVAGNAFSLGNITINFPSGYTRLISALCISNQNHVMTTVVNAPSSSGGTMVIAVKNFSSSTINWTTKMRVWFSKY